MNARQAVRIAMIALFATETTERGLHLPPELDAEIDELIGRADDFAGSLTNEEADAAIIAELSGMVGAIKCELGAIK